MSGTAFPTGISLTKFDIALVENKATFQSLFTREKYSVSLAAGTADRWEGVLETAPLTFTEAKPMMAFLVSVGLNGLFNIADPMYSGAASGATTGLVQGASQSGTSLIVDGLANSTLILRAGEYFQVNEEYKIATADCTTNGSGVVTLTFRPALRASPADNATVTFNTPRLLCVMTSMPPKSPEPGGLLHRFSFSFEEAM